MLKIRWILGPVLLLGPAAALCSAQVQGSDSDFRSNARRAAGLNQAPKFIGRNSMSRGRLGTFNSTRYGGITTIPEQVRSLMPQRNRYSRFDLQPLPTSPIKRSLDRQNLLSVRSPLAKKTTSTIGRNDFVTDAETGQMFGDYSRIEKLAESVKTPVNPEKADDGKFQDAIVRRLEAKANEYYDSGTAAFRKGKYINANGYFDLVKEVESDKTRPYLAKVMVGTQREDFLSAHVNLLRAIDLAQDLNTLKIDTSKFYRPEDFRRRVELMNLKASRTTENAYASLLQSYYLWLNGDIETAISTAAVAERNSPGDSGRAVKKYRDLLIRHRMDPIPAVASPPPATSQAASPKTS